MPEEHSWLVVLEPGVYLADGEGDPCRTVVRGNAKRFRSNAHARVGLLAARKYRPFAHAKVARVKPFVPAETL